MSYMQAGRFIGPEDATIAEVFDICAQTLVRLQRTEEVVMILGGVVLHHLGKLSGPAEDGTLDEAAAEIADYMLLITDAIHKAQVDVQFLNARE